MRPPEDMPPRQPGGGRRSRRGRESSGRGRWFLAAGLVILFILLTSLRGVAGIYTDYLWFDSVGLASVWRGVVGSKIALAVIFTVLFSGLLWLNLYLADRMAPTVRSAPDSPEDEFVDRYRDLVGRRAGLVRVVVAIVAGLFSGLGVSSQWQDWILFTNRVDFGRADETFGVDIGFYVFQLPFLEFLADWLFLSLLIIAFITLVAHYLNGGIRLQAATERVTPRVKAHLSVLLGLAALIKAGQYWLSTYGLVYDTGGTVDGATYTASNVQLKALYLLIIISVTSAALFLVNIRRRGWVLPVLAVGLWAFVALLAGQIVPALFQRFQVQPEEASREAPYIENNIEATRDGMNLDDVETSAFGTSPSEQPDQNGPGSRVLGELTAAELQDNADIIRNIRLWDPAVTETSLQRFQGTGLRDYYAINDIDADRYELNGETTPVNVGARDLSTPGVPQDSWVAERLTYTHGFGAVQSPSNASSEGGQPVLTIADVPPQSSEGAPELTQPRIYIGENQSDYVIVNTDVNEFDFPREAAGNEETRYNGADGVPLDSIVRRGAFALRFGDVDPVISGNVNDDSRVIMQRNVRERLREVAPFLSFDADPYPVVVDGEITWVVDAYTTTDQYPNAQRADQVDVGADSDLPGSFNYIRNSVKATVDAYDGTIKLYVIDDSDPLVQAYADAFPDLFTSGDEVPPDIEAHFRYPEDLFRIQTTMWGRYHIDDTDAFYQRSDEWNVAPDPEVTGSRVPGGESTAATTPTTRPSSTNVSNQRGGRVDPYYLQMRLPGADEPDFVLLRSFVAGSQGNQTRALTAFMAARGDPENYGQLESFEMPAGNLPPGPQDIVNALNSDDTLARALTELCQRGSQCPSTNLLVVPIEDSLLYVRPLYVEAEGGNAVPQLQKVIAAYQEDNNIEVAMNDTLEGSLTDLFGDSPDTEEAPDPSDNEEQPAEPDQPAEPGQPEGSDEPEGTQGSDGPQEPGQTGGPEQPEGPQEPGQPGNGGQVDEALLTEIEDTIAAIDQALSEGNLGEYQAEVENLKGLIAELRSDGGVGAAGGSSEGASPDGGTDGGGAGGNPDGSATTTPGGGDGGSGGNGPPTSEGEA